MDEGLEGMCTIVENLLLQRGQIVIRPSHITQEYYMQQLSRLNRDEILSIVYILKRELRKETARLDEIEREEQN